ncbi:MAG: radical SAM protein, partial [Eggerthellaceae bacterium]|nr:radical SAM protein [Eggerthellaceae bacterium]
TVKRYYLGNARGQRFLGHAALSMAKQAKVRARYAKEGVNVPPFLIASIASECNLDCIGCYARATGTVNEEARENQLSNDAWARIFKEADEIGVSFILLAGGEPTLRRNVIETAASFKNIIFPVFTNGTFMDDAYLSLFDRRRNLIPVFSVEGDDMQTDARRGLGVAARVRENMAKLTERNILWGTSITVTTENMEKVTSDDYVSDLYERSCGLIIYNEFVPIERGTAHLALKMPEHDELMARMKVISDHDRWPGLNAIAFPGNEEYMGGCLAAGRGFFHISQSGNAEPCPFSPYSVANVAEVGLIGALKSPFFSKIREVEAAHASEHMGGCTLFTHRSEVMRVIEELSS